MITIAGLSEIADRYDCYVVDLWGVMHDGVSPYPAAVECLRELRRRGRSVALLSNAPRRTATAAQALRILGIDDSLYDVLETSGEATYRALATRPDPWFQALGNSVLHLGPPRDRSVFAGLGLREATSPADASFLLNTGPDDQHPADDPACHDELMAGCFAAGLPMLCANPDLLVHRAGKTIICAGALAERYAGWGGEVRFLGKPDPRIYQRVLPPAPDDRRRTLAIGDSLRTDIAGAHAAGIDAVWVLGGIHAAPDDASVIDEAARSGILPTYATARLAW